MKKLWDLKKLLSYLELEGQGCGIIMKVTRPLLLGPFYLVKWLVNPNILAASVPALFDNILDHFLYFRKKCEKIGVFRVRQFFVMGWKAHHRPVWKNVATLSSIRGPIFSSCKTTWSFELNDTNSGTFKANNLDLCSKTFFMALPLSFDRHEGLLFFTRDTNSSIT